MAVMSVQSHVSCGYVGNAAAAFCLRRLGVETWPVHTVLLSNHPGHGAARGKAVDPGLVADVMAGIEDRGAYARCRAVLGGYLGSAATGEALLNAVARVRLANADALFACDPVMGDEGKGAYVDDAVVDFYRTRALAAIDVLLPNTFELGQLTGVAVGGLADAVAAARRVMERGPGLVVVTSVPGPDDAISTIAIAPDEAWCVTTPRLPGDRKGAGDALAALFVGNYLRDGNAAAALTSSVSSVFGILAAGRADGLDLSLVAAQDEIVAPSRRFDAVAVGG